jgi:hypothetical protein
MLSYNIDIVIKDSILTVIKIELWKKYFLSYFLWALQVIHNKQKHYTIKP